MTTAISNTQTQTPFFLLSNISNYVTVKLDHTNYLMWKFQITGILDAYSLLDHLEDPTSCPSQFLLGQNLETQEVNPLHLQWKARDKTLVLIAQLHTLTFSHIFGNGSDHCFWNLESDS
jgi:hypothetical protein